MNRGDDRIRGVADLPDYGALKKLAAALWHEDNSYQGAAVMVGAGFSRSVAHTGDVSRKLPVWSDLAKTLAEALAADDRSDPLRLAEEYCACFGKQALYDLLKKEINDAAWIPGELHRSLLELPWSEVLTTNWDTLLERTSSELHQRVYSVVYRQEDLSAARSPRIVKLHGTINTTEYLIFTQEDYRKYPYDHAALVNFARQVFIENELCLLGFSGDDPNFLQWTGWVRDHLATHARRIYLVGALNLSTARRRYLESINIAPIDFGSLVADRDGSDTRHEAATRLFLECLQHLKPKQLWEWSPTQLTESGITNEELSRRHQDHNYAASVLDRQLECLEADRKAYPGWLFCPISVRRRLSTQISTPLPTPQNLAALAPNRRAKLLYEIAWRHSVTYELVSPWLAQELLAICEKGPTGLSKSQQMEIANLLLKNSRWSGDPSHAAVERKAIDIMQRIGRDCPDSANEIAFHNAIVARDQFDYTALEGFAAQIAESDTVWKIRKASLLAELGRFSEGEHLVAEAYRDLVVQHRHDRNSVYVFSRLAWSHWLKRGIEMLKPGIPFEPFPLSYQESKCSPWDHIEFLKTNISNALQKQYKRHQIEPSFEPGSYKNNSDTVTLTSELHPALLLDGLASAGMPLRWNHVNFLAEPAAGLAELDEIQGAHRFAFAIRAADSESTDVLKQVFSRARVACLAEHNAECLFDQCIHAVEYWSSRLSVGTTEVRQHALDRLRVFMETLARVSVRATPDRAKQAFQLACSLGHREKFRHFWLFTPLRHLIDYSLASVPRSEHCHLLLEALKFPLQVEVAADDHERWPNPVIEYPGSREQNSALDRRIAEIIDGIPPCSMRSAPALLRLMPLIEAGFLTEDELRRTSRALWGTTPEFQVLPDTGLLKSVLLELPSDNPVAVETLVRRYLFEADDKHLLDPERLMDIARAGQLKQYKQLPSQEQAECYFNRLVAWRPQNNDKDPFGISQRNDRETGELIGAVLAHSIAPALSPAAMTVKAFEKLSSFGKEIGAPETIRAFPYFAVKYPPLSDRVEAAIRQEFRQLDANRVANASYALLLWRNLDNSDATDRLRTILISQIGSNRMPGMAAMLWTAQQMHRKSYLSHADTDALVEILPVIFDNADYGSIPAESRDAVSTSIVRAACVRLASDISASSPSGRIALSKMLEAAKQDPLPEVRFAEATGI